ncbi:MAG: ATP-binding protein [bacterium]
MHPVSAFFEIPAIRRYRLFCAVGAGCLFCILIARLALADLPGVQFYPLELLAAGTLALFAAFGEQVSFSRHRPNSALYWALLPALCHFLHLNYERHIDPAALLALNLVMVFGGVIIESNSWRRALILTWGGGTIFMAWTVAEPITAPLGVTVVFSCIGILLYFVAGGLHAARTVSADALSLLDETQGFSGVGGWQKNYATNEIRWTPAAYRILDLPQNTPATLDVRPYLVSDPEHSPLVKATEHMLATGEPYDVVDQLRTASGRQIWVHCRAKIIFADGRPQRALGVFTDITAQIEKEHELTAAKEAAETAARARTDFLANMSHEIRTPMNGVIGMASLLSQQPLDTVSRNYVNVIRASGESLLHIINDILDFSKLDAGKMSIEKKEFVLHKLVEDTTNLVQQSAQEKHLALVVENHVSPEACYIGDAHKIKQVLVNLLSNAVKFTTHGSVQFSVTAELDQSLLDTLTFTVADTGIGIDPIKLPSLFDAFTQEDTSITRKYGGTGLGLAISKALLDEMDGHINVHSHKGAGTTFTVHLKLARSLSRPAAAPPIVHTTHSNSDLRVLLAEDNAVNQQVAQLMLKKLGCAAEVAQDGAQAVAAIRQAPYDIVFMDLQMPEMDGLEATRCIREDTTLHQPYIVALTANAMHADRDRCLAAGMNNFIAKPVRIRDLQAVLEEAQVALKQLIS